MANCPNDTSKMVGRVAFIEVADGCADTVPTAGEWKLFGAMTTKSFDLSPDTVTSDADDSGAFNEGLVTSASLTISGDGEFRKRDKPDEYGVYAAIRYFVGELQAKRQPSLWVRLDWGDMIIQMYANITALSGEAPTKELVTYSVEFQPADGNTVQFLDGDDPAVTAIAVTPTTSTGVEGTTGTFTVNFTPTDAENQSYTVVSSNATVATVTKSGNTVTINRLDAGTSTITVTSDDGNFTATHTATVTAA